MATLVAALALAVALSYSFEQSPATIRRAVDEIPAGPASALNTVLARIPSSAEVVASLGVMGRFSSRRYCYAFDPLRAVPVHDGTIVFVFSASHLELVTVAGLERAVSDVRDRLRAQVLVSSDGVTALLWHPPAGSTSVRIPAVQPAIR